MSYKTILVHVDEAKHLASQLALANQIASREQAHLVGIAATGISGLQDAIAVTNIRDPALPPYLETLRQRGQRALASFEKEASNAGLTSYETLLLDEEAVTGISLRGRYADLVIVGQDNTTEPSPTVRPGFPAHLTLSSGTPTLVVPCVGVFNKIGERILIAWNASVQALHAVRGAMPFLLGTQSVDVAVYNATGYKDVYGEEPGADIALYLSRHGVKVNVMQEEIGRESEVGDAILALAQRQGADLLVMGCYGHSRIRETILGGVTRNILASMSLPVLMAH